MCIIIMCNIEVINKNMFILNATSYLIQNVPHSSQRSN